MLEAAYRRTARCWADRILQATDEPLDILPRVLADRTALESVAGRLAAAGAELLTAGQTLVSADCDGTPRDVERVIDAGVTAGAHQPRTVATHKDVAA